ncbi:MFS transporter [Streptomyces avermitilis]
MPHAGRLLAGTLIGRLPTGMAPLAIVLTSASGSGYGLAGGLAALYLLANALGGPLLGRMVDRCGQTRALTIGATVSSAAFLAMAAGHDRSWQMVAAVLVAGVAKPPLDAALRALWGSGSVMPTQEHTRVALALDAASQELIFVIGPLLVAGITASTSASWALVTTAGLGLVGTAVVVTAPPSRSWKTARQGLDWLGPLRTPRLRVLYLTMVCVGVPMGALTPLAVSEAERFGDAGLSGALPAALSVGAFLGGLAYGARSWPGVTADQLIFLTGAFTLGWLPLTTADESTTALLACVVPGLFMAPLLGAAYLVTMALAPPGTVTEASALLVAALDIGCAAGSAIAGLALTQALLPAGSAAAFLILLGARHFRRRSRDPLLATSAGTAP